jgi:hypothetical protein
MEVVETMGIRSAARIVIVKSGIPGKILPTAAIAPASKPITPIIRELDSKFIGESSWEGTTSLRFSAAPKFLRLLEKFQHEVAWTKLADCKVRQLHSKIPHDIDLEIPGIPPLYAFHLGPSRTDPNKNSDLCLATGYSDRTLVDIQCFESFEEESEGGNIIIELIDEMQNIYDGPMLRDRRKVLYSIIAALENSLSQRPAPTQVSAPSESS